jgi:hypothetical protein
MLSLDISDSGVLKNTNRGQILLIVAILFRLQTVVQPNQSNVRGLFSLMLTAKKNINQHCLKTVLWNKKKMTKLQQVSGVLVQENLE